MSADFTTKNFAGYFHEDYVYVVDCNGEPVGSFTPEMVAELQSIVDRWKGARLDALHNLPAACGNDEPHAAHAIPAPPDDPFVQFIMCAGVARP